MKISKQACRSALYAGGKMERTGLKDVRYGRKIHVLVVRKEVVLVVCVWKGDERVSDKAIAGILVLEEDVPRQSCEHALQRAGMLKEKEILMT